MITLSNLPPVDFFSCAGGGKPAGKLLVRAGKPLQPGGFQQIAVLSTQGFHFIDAGLHQIAVRFMVEAHRALVNPLPDVVYFQK